MGGNEHSTARLTDSPWFWAMLFALFGILAVAAISSRYGRRQSGIERKYQARERRDQNEENEQPPRGFSEPGDNLVPLWPLAIVLAAIAFVAAAMLLRSRGARPARRLMEMPDSGSLTPDPRPPTPQP
jgi:hypothetical protein